jgi:Sulfotransferase family
MQLILIGGGQRSGTTLLQTLLANALGSPNLPEAHILSDILAAYKRAQEFGNKTGFFYPTDDSLLSFFRSFAERHVADIAAGDNRSALVLKDPNFIQTLDEAAAIFPEAIRIVCMRDPRDIAASFVQIGSRQNKPGKYKKRDILFISKKILASYQPLLPGIPAGVVMVRYEDLASDPKASLQALGRDAGLKLSLDRIEDAAWLDAPARHEAAWISELEGAKPSPASIGSFKRVLLDEEVAVVQRVCQPIMSQFAYTPTDEAEPRRWAGIRRFFRLR